MHDMHIDSIRLHSYNCNYVAFKYSDKEQVYILKRKNKKYVF